MEDILQAQESVGGILNIFLIVLISYALIEMAYLYFFIRYDKMQEYKQTSLNFVFVVVLNIVISSLIGTISTAVFSIWAYQKAFFTIDMLWYGWLYGLVVYEFFYWVQHWLAHKVRFLWCLHSPHHAPESMNLFVGFNHHFLEGLFYMPFFLGFMPTLFGVHPVIVVIISLVDVVWGNMLHINDTVVKGRYGFLEKILQTPSYHRVHHAQNVRYMDTNYNSITLLWDWIMGTRQPLLDQEPVQYGITRQVKTTSFWDVQFGEYALLFKDVWQAPGIKNKLLYLIMPPGWSHTGDQKTARAQKSALKQVERVSA